METIKLLLLNFLTNDNIDEIKMYKSLAKFNKVKGINIKRLQDNTFSLFYYTDDDIMINMFIEKNIKSVVNRIYEMMSNEENYEEYQFNIKRRISQRRVL